jgi:hypothetical protein
LHRVEAQVRLLQARRPDRFHRLLLETLDTAQALDRLQDRLGLGRPVLRQALRELEAEGLAQSTAEGSWTLTDRGQQARQQGEYACSVLQRRPFYFLESGRPGQPPHFLHLNAVTAIPWPAGEGWTFDRRTLTDCVRQPAEWKRRHGFPLEVEEVLGTQVSEQASTPAPAEDPALAARSNHVATELDSAPWQQVILDQPERLLTILVQARAEQGKDRLLGYAVQQKGWGLDTSAPIFSLEGGLAELFPDLVPDLPLERWRQAWKTWGQANNLTPAEIEGSTLRRQDHRLQVTVPRSVLDKLRAARSDAVKGEAWVLGGDERIRPAAQLELVAAGGGR